MAKFYTDVWYRDLAEKIGQCKDLSAYQYAAEKLQKSMYSDSIDQERKEVICTNH